MNLKIVLCSIALVIVTTTEGFVVVVNEQRSNHRSFLPSFSSSSFSPTSLVLVRNSVGSGWDNTDFLNSLSGNSDEIASTNNVRYQKYSEIRDKHQQWRQMQQQQQQPGSSSASSSQLAGSTGSSNDEDGTNEENGKNESENENENEEGQGGSRFKEMMEKGKQAAASRPQQQRDEGDGAVASGGGPVLYNPMDGLPSTSSSSSSSSTTTPPDATTTTTAATGTSLSIEEQAQLFQKFLQMQQQQDGGTPISTPSHQKKHTSGGTRKQHGRNRDADTIANTADLYFAQLKRDSTIRTLARHDGDVNTANAVFADDGVKELEGMIQTNPYLKNANKDSALLDTSADEMIAVMKMTAGNNPDGRNDDQMKKSTGPSYKQKLAERRKAGRQDGAAAAAAAASLVTAPDTPKVAAAAVAPIVPEIPTLEPERKASPSNVGSTSAAPTTPIRQTTKPEVSKSGPAVTTPPPTTTTTGQQMGSTKMSTPPGAHDASSAPPTESTDKEEVRRGLRTLMGLILKHRGGPGFGKGRLKGPEAEGFENLLGEITELLRSEVSATDVATVAAADVKQAAPMQTTTTTTPPAAAAAVAGQEWVFQTPSQSTVTPPPPKEEVSVPSPPQQQVVSPPVSNYPSSSSSAMTFTAPGLPDDRMTRSIACFEGAVQMYKNSSPEIQEGLMIPLRGALMAAVNTCNQIIMEKDAAASLDSISTSDVTSRSASSSHGQMTSTIACVEGAVQMYKNSPPQVQESLMVPLLGALMSAVNTCNQIIAEKEVDNVRAYRELVPPPPSAQPSDPTTPAQFFEVTPYNLADDDDDVELGEEEQVSSVAKETTTVIAPEPKAANVASAPSIGTDEHSMFLQKVYDSLEKATGNGKFGLGNLSSEEAAALADQVVEMKAMLIEELDTGIPAASEDTVGVSPSGESEQGSSSKYQQMLAKAKAEKGSK